MISRSLHDSSSAKVGFYSSIVLAVITTITFVIAIFTPPLGGPLCESATCYQYPYLDTASRFPHDFIWMYPAMLLLIAYAVVMTCLHHTASEDKKVYSHIGLLFAMFAAGVLISNYFVQVSVIQPSLLKNEVDGIALLSQFNPHGLFIVLEELGYLFMAVAFLFMAPLFKGGKLNKVIRRTFQACFVLTLLSLVYFTFKYGIFREYLFEIASISFNWLTLILSGIFLAIYFKKINISS